MDKCRICLKSRNRLISIYHAEDGLRFLDMITSLANHIKIYDDDGTPDSICSCCRKRLREAYDFKLTIERSDSLLNEQANRKRISFNSIKDIKVKIEIDTDRKSLIPCMPNYSQDLFKDGVNTIEYKDTVIKKIEYKDTVTKKIKDDDDTSQTQITVNEFLHSVKMEPDNNDYYDHCDYDVYDADSDYEEKPKKKKKATKIKTSNKGSATKAGISQFKSIKPIKPIMLEDIFIERAKPKQILPRKRRAIKEQKNVPSICPYCAKILTNSKTLDSHILLHTGERKFKCDLCPHSCFTQSALRCHRKKHTDPRIFNCNQCIAKFRNENTLKSHLISHSGPKAYVCEICNKGFTRKSHLDRHQNVHNLTRKNVHCELCSMSFYNKVNLRHHMRVHTGERPFKCELCSQPYSYKHDFNRHCLKKHGVFLKSRQVYVMNEEVLQRERALMKDLTLHAHGLIKAEEILKPFDGPSGHIAYKQVMDAVQAKIIPISF